jgi:hypothetical protein
MGIKNYIIAAILVALPLIAGCQQRTDFDACVEYYEQKVKGQKDDVGYDLSPKNLWKGCK